MKILVTGAQGQVGSSLVGLAKELGHQIFALASSDLDISNRQAVLDCLAEHQPDIVINAAAYTAVDRAEEESARANAVNADGPESLAMGCKTLDIPLLHISTDFVFSGDKDGAYLETDPIGPLSVYGKSKAEGEDRIEAVDGKYIILRTAWVFGGAQNFVTTMLRLGAERDKLNIVDDQVGGPTWSEDIANCLLKITDQCQADGFKEWGIYHYSGNPSVSWYGFACAIFEGRNKPVLHPILTEQYPTPATRPKNSVLDCEKIKRVFDIDQPDWRPALSKVLSRS